MKGIPRARASSGPRAGEHPPQVPPHHRRHLLVRQASAALANYPRRRRLARVSALFEHKGKVRAPHHPFRAERVDELPQLLPRAQIGPTRAVRTFGRHPELRRSLYAHLRKPGEPEQLLPVGIAHALAESEVVHQHRRLRVVGTQRLDLLDGEVEPVEAHEPDGRVPLAAEREHLAPDAIGHLRPARPQPRVEPHGAVSPVEQPPQLVHAAAVFGRIREAAPDEFAGVLFDDRGHVGVVELEVDGLDDQGAVHASLCELFEQGFGGGDLG
mmetsp:Transcript_3830/g.15575  ORF Transcript_3830/g.15575 Transcript_3830/m.15575 type:complete len:270 (+) Transcript_3830:2941-3750(+)